MGWDNAGGYIRNHNFSADASAGIKILAARMDVEMDDFASALTITVTRNAQNVPTANLPMGGFRHINVGAPTSVNNYMRSREFIENVPIFMQDQQSSADRISVSAQYFTSVSANQAPGDGTRIIVRLGSDKSSAALYLNGHSANVAYADGVRVGASALSSGGIYEFIFSSADATWRTLNPGYPYYRRTASEVAALVTPANYHYPEGDARRYGAVGDDSTDNSTALTNWLTLCEAAGIEAYLPYGIYRYSTAIDLDNSNPGGFSLRGDSTGDYGTSFGNAPTRGSILKYTGSGVALTIDSGTTTAPKYVRIQGITFHDGGTATDGLRLISSTWCEIDRCVFAYFDQTGANGLRLSINALGFTGGIWLTRSVFIGCDTAIYSDSTSVNIFHVISCGLHSNVNGVVMGPSATQSFFRDIQFVRCDFEENDGTDILFNGGCGSVLISYNYFEQNDNAENDPRIHFAGTGPTNGFAQGIDIHTNVFSKGLNNAGEALIRINNVDGLMVYNNWSAFPSSGTNSDRYFVELITPSTNFFVEPSLNVSGATSYPILYSGTTYTTALEARSVRYLTVPTIVPSVNTQSSNYTIAASDAGTDKMLINGGAATTYTLEDFATVPIPVGSTVKICNAHSTNDLTIGRSGVALYQGNADSDLTVGPRRIVWITHISTDVWVVEDASGLT